MFEGPLKVPVKQVLGVSDYTRVGKVRSQSSVGLL